MIKKNNFDFIRFFAAMLVIYSHIFPLTGNQYNGELIAKITKNQISGGGLGVAIFFMISGYLITKSWMQCPNVLLFIKKRALRILPALTCVVLISILIIGPLYTSLPLNEYFRNKETWQYVKNVFLWDTYFNLPCTFDDLPYPRTINGSLWTLPYEIKCYFAVLCLGIAKVFNHKLVSLAIWSLSLLFINFQHPLAYLFAYFCTGSMYYCFRDTIPFKRWMLWFSIVVTMCACVYGHGLNTALIIYGSYILFYFVFSDVPLNNFGKYGDFSYGMYIYAFPIQQMTINWLQDFHYKPITLLMIQLPIIFVVSVISWKVIEKPFLRFK